jgi:hypothetical protein
MSIERNTYTVEVSAEVVEQYLDWTNIGDLPAVWFKVVPQADGSAEVWFNSGEARPDDA